MIHLIPKVLILSSKFDFASDYIAAELKIRKIPYLRLNQENFPDMELNLFPTVPKLIGRFKNIEFEIKDKILKSIFFRRPVFLRDNYNPNLTPEQQLSRSQWAAFNRGMTIFTKCRWVNHPQFTYVAENKSFQLYIAKSLGFKIPKTLITNANNYINKFFLSKRELVCKSLDSLLLRINGKEAFVYTNLLATTKLTQKNLAISPVILQECLYNKTDVRVTVVDEKIFPAEIKHQGKNIIGDWRLIKNKVEYIPVELPKEINDKCIKLLKSLNLLFGAIDLAKVNNNYYFLEINPTGEWAWLVDKAKLPIDKAITDLLTK